MLKNSAIKLFNPSLSKRGFIRQVELILRFKNSDFQEKRPRLITISKVPSKFEKISIILILKVINLQSYILKRRINLSLVNCRYAFLHNVINPNEISAAQLA